LDAGYFSEILDWFVMLNVDEIILLGGEPTMHPHFKDFLDIIKNKKIFARMFTNGSYNSNTADLVLKNEYISTIFFHYDESYLKYSGGSKKKFLNNLKQASLSHKKIWLRWNIDNPDVDNSRVISLAEKYSASIGYSISAPTPYANPIPLQKAHNYAGILIDLVKSARDADIEIEPARALPLCVFNSEQLEFLKENGNLQGNCIAINDLTVNTDLSLQLCSISYPVRLPKPKGIEELREHIEYLKKEELKLKSEPVLPECNECKFFAEGECQGGCYAYKFYAKE
jgi:hypothetical protein